jgi:trk system potassium uptake protein TrkA
MDVIVAGCGRVGAVLAYQLYKKDNVVTVIDQNVLAFENLPTDFNGRVIEGDVLDLKVLQRAGIEKADAFVAATDRDSVNAVAGHLAMTVFNISNVVVSESGTSLEIGDHAFGLQSVGSASWGVAIGRITL